MPFKISVVIPTHNRPSGLEKALGSLKNQSEKFFEIIVVDDGSKIKVDRSVFIGFPQSVDCHIVRNEIPMGGNNARNNGIVKATGEYIAFLDDDDQFKAEKIELVLKAIEENPSVDVFYHPAHIHMPVQNISYFSRPQKFETTEELFKRLLIGNCIGGTPMVIAKKSTLISIGMFDEEMPALQDYELWLRLAKLGSQFHLIDTALTDYYQVTKVPSITKSDDAIQNARQKLDDLYVQDINPEILRCVGFERAKTDILRALLNHNMWKAFKISFCSFIKFRSLRFLFSAFLCCTGVKLYFQILSANRKDSYKT